MSSLADTQSERFELGAWTVEPSTGTLSRDGATERLEPRVMSLLCLLASKPGRVFSKQELFDAIWGVPIVEDTTLARCISDLRRALGDDARNPRYIETIPKKGYRLIADTSEPGPVTELKRQTRTTTRRTRVVLLIALSLVVGLSLYLWQLVPKSEEESTVVPTLPAYDYYLQGRDHYRKYRRAENEQAIELFRLAVAADPSFALGHAGLANALAMQEGNYGIPGNWTEQAMESAKRALELQPGLAEGHKALGHVLAVEERYLEAAEHFRKSLEIRPEYQEALSGLGMMLYLTGDFVDGLAQFDKAHELGFESATTAQHVGWIYWRLGLYDHAEYWFRRAIDFEAHHTGARKGLAWVDLSRGEIESAREKISVVLDVHPDCDTCLALSGDIELVDGELEAARDYFQRAYDVRGGNYNYGALRLGQVGALLGEDQADEMLVRVARNSERYIEEGSGDVLLLWSIAVSEALRGEPDKAVAQLESAWLAGYRRWDFDEAAFESLRGDPRYQVLLNRNRESLMNDRARLQDSAVEPQ